MKYLRSILFLAICGLLTACVEDATTPPKAASGVSQAQAIVQTQADGLTIEQQNIKRRLETDNMPGSLKHLYVLSAFSGDVILYSTVKGKVTSSGKRLTPYQVSTFYSKNGTAWSGFPLNISGREAITPEVLQDDGTYGSSVDYLYWWDSKGIYHQHYVSGGQIVHISSQPLRVGKVLLNLETGSVDRE